MLQEITVLDGGDRPLRKPLKARKPQPPKVQRSAARGGKAKAAKTKSAKSSPKPRRSAGRKRRPMVARDSEEDTPPDQD